MCVRRKCLLICGLMEQKQRCDKYTWKGHNYGIKKVCLKGITVYKECPVGHWRFHRGTIPGVS